MLLSVAPVVYVVHARGATRMALPGRNALIERSVGLKQRKALYRDGEWVCAVVHFVC